MSCGSSSLDQKTPMVMGPGSRFACPGRRVVLASAKNIQRRVLQELVFQLTRDRARSCKQPYAALKESAKTKAGDNIRQPVRKQDDTRGDQGRARCPNQIAPLRRQQRGGRGERTDMQGMAGRKSVVGVAG